MAGARGRTTRIGAAVLTAVLVAGCSGSPDDEPAGETPEEHGPGTPVASQAVDTTGTGEPSGLVISEVGFAPADGDQPWVEIANVGDEPADLADMRLVAGGRAVGLPADETLDAGGVLVVPFEGELDSAEGVVVLSEDEQLVDSVSWGDGGGTVSLIVGDFVPATFEPGSTIARWPGANRPRVADDWALYPPAATSPGTANPVPPVDVLLPIDGALLDPADPTLSWYPVRGAASYRVQVADDDTFSDPLIDDTVTEPRVDVADLGDGDFVWRVQALDADGVGSQQSRLSQFTLGGPIPRATGRTQTTRLLAMKHLWQAKDTTMLLLESPYADAPRAWDEPHVPKDMQDPADKMNCALAMIAMLNRFYGGDLSQDRIGYEIFKDRKPGPEEDLNYGYGLRSGTPPDAPAGFVDETMRAFNFALGPGVTWLPTMADNKAIWSTITAALDAGRPVAAATHRHGMVINGYAVQNGKQMFRYHDPANGAYLWQDLAKSKIPPANFSMWLMPDAVRARKQEPGVTKDSDGDKVVDFDETERFHTDPAETDSDRDDVTDKPDIASGIFDPTYGYADHRDTQGRDFDGDGVATELDPDSDQGGCDDGDEDKNGDGYLDDKETWNFDSTDDICGDVSGSITWTYDHSRDGPNDETETTHDVVTVSVRFDEEDGEWVDAGSSYTWNGSGQADSNPGDDPEMGYCNEHHKTTTTTGGGPFESSLASSIFLDVDRDAGEVYVNAWVEGVLSIHQEDGTWMSDGTAAVWCELVPHDSTQGGGSTIDSAAEWTQIARCANADEWMLGTLSDDGRTATFDCDTSEDYEPTEGATANDTMRVSGSLTFAKGS